MALRTLLGLLIGIAACTTHNARGTSTPRFRDPTRNALLADLGDDRRHHRYNEALLLLTVSLDSMPLTAVERLETARIHRSLLQRVYAVGAAKSELLNLLADGLAVSHVERERTEQATTRLVAALQVAGAATGAAITQLHHVLASRDRGSLADQMVAHPSWWAEANKHDADRFRVITNVLTSAPRHPPEVEQQTRFSISAAPGSSAPAGASLRSFTDTFRTDTFDARWFVRPVDAEVTAWKRLGHFCAVVGPSLLDSQRRHLVGVLRRLARAYDAPDAPRSS